MKTAAISPTDQLASTAARGLFRRRLLSWYDRNRRDLPWRGQRDPYRIWVSEVMLQQTRVAAVLAHYQRFLERFPDVHALAAASLDSVLAVWSGLGYYRRARMLHQAAQVIVSRHGGELPRGTAELRQLPGFGRYTAAAVASIAFAEPVAVVDGNVERVFGRLFAGQGSKGEGAWQAAQQLLALNRPGDFNQAMMELGATVCVPGDPECARCPVIQWCATRGRGAAKNKERRRRRTAHYRLAQRAGSVFLVQRGADVRLMPKMWELPELRLNGTRPPVALRLRHSITVTDFIIEVSLGDPPSRRRGRWLTPAQVEELPLTGLTRKILRSAKFI
ncbi:MAG TPA: A/G-specific adenine glycosylase [Terriglobales bacterium]|nr:A/G-specific adenine glycosylase [Terriglobales bacterium]